ncbi:DnaJ C-terminal domain-containing protein [Streptomyces sp. NPDC059070]|uniref:caspase, EACC1-associated type n=1 Tax=Streptomyces sp. NPDC059070 TaxID=3346713 RepID=UPI0036C5A1C8
MGPAEKSGDRTGRDPEGGPARRERWSDGPGSRDALLIATGEYVDPALRTLRSPGQDCRGLAEVLGHPDIGAFRTEQLRDRPAHQVARALEGFFRDRGRDDLLLLHLSGHGIKDDDGHLYFAARDTDRGLPASTAIPAAFLHDRMERCRARTIVVLLDCCYSGAFLPGSKGDDQVHVREELSGHGRVVLTATNRIEYAWEGERPDTAAPQPSRFTGALIEGLRSGAADLDGDGRITVTELYDYVYERLRRSGVRQTPRMWADVEYRVVLARVAEVAPVSAPPPEVRPAEVLSPGVPPPASPPRSGPERSRRTGQDALLRLDLTLEETVFGATKEIRFDTAVVCPVCRGLAVARHMCARCGGEGRVREVRTLALRIPAGVENGTRLLLRGKGEAGKGGGPAGDLYVEVHERPDARFRRRGDDLHSTHRIPRELAESGGQTRIDTLDGPRTVLVPAGTVGGRTLRLRRLGVQRPGSPGRGSLLVRLEVDE